MNNVKIAAALHALADAFLEGDDQPAKAGKATKPKPPVVEPAAAPAPVVEEAAPVAAPVSTVTKEQLNKLVLAVAAKERDAAVAILEKRGHKNTVTLPPEHFQAVYDELEELKAKIDAAAAQAAQASLV